MKIFKTKNKGMFFVTILWLSLLQTPSGFTEELEKIKVGVVPQFTAQEIRITWDPILLSIAQKAGVHFVFVGSPSIPDFEKKLLNAEFDMVYLNPYHMIMANRSHNYQPIIRDVGKSLRGILVARKDSGITDISQLKDQVVAFPAPNALGASLLIRAELETVHNIKIKPKYVKNHTSTYLNVLLGQAAAGGGVMKTLNKQSGEIQEALRIIYKTEKVAPHPIALHPRVNEKNRRAIINAFIELSKTPEGQSMLSRIPITKVGEATMEDYLNLEKMGLEKFVVQ